MLASLKHYTILFAEDESIIRLNIARQLKKYFHTVFTAQDGEEALAMYKREKIDMLLLDINMPKLSGLDVARSIRESQAEIPILILTAYTKSPILLDAIELNITKYLVKPIQKPLLREALEISAVLLEEQHKDILALTENFYWDKELQKLYAKSEEVKLSSRERQLMQVLVKYHQCSVSHEQLLAVVWEDKFEDEVSIDSLKNLVNSIRKKLPNESIRSVYGEGYLLQ